MLVSRICTVVLFLDEFDGGERIVLLLDECLLD